MANISLNLHHFLLLSFLLALSFGTLNLVKADEKLIDQKCRDTEAVALCIQCIKSDPRGEKATTAVDIASIVINCLTNHSETLVKHMSILASRHPADKKFVSVCQNCLKGYSGAKESLSTAIAKLKKGDYDGANHFVVFALNDAYVQSCEPSLEEYKDDVVPLEVFYSIRAYEDLSGVAMAIIDRLKYQEP